MYKKGSLVLLCAGNKLILNFYDFTRGEITRALEDRRIFEKAIEVYHTFPDIGKNIIYTVFQDQYELFPIIHYLHSGVLRLSEARARINIEHINLEASTITRRLNGTQGLK